MTRPSSTATQTNQDRYAYGLNILDSIDGEAGHKVVAALRDIAPDRGLLPVTAE